MEKRREWKETQFVAIQGRKSILLPTHPPATAAGGDHKHNSNNDQEEEEELVEKLYPERPEQQAVKLAATAISLNIRLKSADMPFSMQERALFHTTSQLRANSPSRRPNLTLLARSLKKEFDGVYGPAWHCVVGKSFGSFVTHTPGGFVYFSVNNNQSRNQGSSSSPLSFLLFKTEVHLVNAKTLPLPLPASPCS